MKNVIALPLAVLIAGIIVIGPWFLLTHFLGIYIGSAVWVLSISAAIGFAFDKNEDR
jgi:hypothetical protein